LSIVTAMAVGAGACERSGKVSHVRYNLEFDSDQKVGTGNQYVMASGIRRRSRAIDKEMGIVGGGRSGWDPVL